MNHYFLLCGIASIIFALIYRKTKDDICLVVSVVFLLPFSVGIVTNSNLLIMLNTAMLWLNFHLSYNSEK